MNSDKEYFDGITTLVGRLHVVVGKKGVRALLFSGERYHGGLMRAPRNPLILRAKKELKEYFAGKRKKFTLPLDPEGTPFQKNCWKVLRAIPYGMTISYSEQAKRLGSPRAMRAVGEANGANPIPIIIPCHRVIGKNGALGGYAGGARKKKLLLALETINTAR